MKIFNIFQIICIYFTSKSTGEGPKITMHAQGDRNLVHSCPHDYGYDHVEASS